MGCGVCIRSCGEKAIVLRLKNPEEIFEPPQTMYDLYEIQAQGRRAKKNED